MSERHKKPSFCVYAIVDSRWPFYECAAVRVCCRPCLFTKSTRLAARQSVFLSDGFELKRRNYQSTWFWFNHFQVIGFGVVQPSQNADIR